MTAVPTVPAKSQEPTPKRRLIRRLGRGTILLMIVGFASFIGGFAAFVATLPQRPADEPAAEAIVVLTGGDDRIDAALMLLKNGRAGRLLISGVHAATGRAALVALHHADMSLFSCCVDLGWEAHNTPGNASEAARWVQEHGYHRIIVVTASYHMPRALLELGAQMENVTLIPYPVTPGPLARDDAWRDPATVALMASEYAKYVAAEARISGGRLLQFAGL